MKKEPTSLSELRKIRKELSEEMEKMSPEQRRSYAKAAEEVYHGLAEMTKIRSHIK